MTGVFMLKNLHKEGIHSLTRMLAWGHKALISIHRNDVRGMIIVNSSHPTIVCYVGAYHLKFFDKMLFLKFLSL